MTLKDKVINGHNVTDDRATAHDHNGRISRSEFRNCMEVLGFLFPMQIYDELFAEFDVDGSGALDKAETRHCLKVTFERMKLA